MVIRHRSGSAVCQCLHNVSTNQGFIHAAGNEPLHLLTQDTFIRLHPLITLGTKGIINDIFQSWGLNTKFPVRPAAACIPIVEPFQKIMGLQLIVIGQGETTCGCRIEDCQHNTIGQLQLGFLAVEYLLKGVFVFRGAENGRSRRHEGVGWLWNEPPLGVPAEEGAASQDHPLFLCQPAQGVVCLLRCLITNRNCLFLLRKPAPVGKAAGIIGRDQLGVSVDGDDALGMLICGSFFFTCDHTENHFTRVICRIVICKCPEQAVIQPAGIDAVTEDIPPYQHLFIFRQPLGIDLHQTTAQQVRKDGFTFDVIQNCGQLRMRICRCFPIGELIHIKPELLFVLGDQIADLIAERMGAGGTRPSGGAFCGRDDDLRLAFIHDSGIDEFAIGIQGDLQFGPGDDMTHGRHSGLALPVLRGIIQVAVIGLHSLLQQSH